MISIQDLFQLGKSQLNDLYKFYEKQIQTSGGLLKEEPENQEVKNKLAIIKAVYKDLLKTQKAELQEKKTSELRAKILDKAGEAEFKELTKGKSYNELLEVAANL